MPGGASVSPRSAARPGGRACPPGPPGRELAGGARLPAAHADRGRLRGHWVWPLHRLAEQVAARSAFDHAVVDLRLGGGDGLALVADAAPDRAPTCGSSSSPTPTASRRSSWPARRRRRLSCAKPVDEGELIDALLDRAPPLPPVPQTPSGLHRTCWEHVMRVYEQCDRNMTQTAQRLGMHRRSLQRFLSKRAPPRARPRSPSTASRLVPAQRSCDPQTAGHSRHLLDRQGGDHHAAQRPAPRRQAPALRQLPGARGARARRHRGRDQGDARPARDGVRQADLQRGHRQEGQGRPGRQGQGPEDRPGRARAAVLRPAHPRQRHRQGAGRHLRGGGARPTTRSTSRSPIRPASGRPRSPSPTTAASTSRSWARTRSPTCRSRR